MLLGPERSLQQVEGVLCPYGRLGSASVQGQSQGSQAGDRRHSPRRTVLPRVRLGQPQGDGGNNRRRDQERRNSSKR